jgi:Flp pilus assembly pilin Flp
VLKLLALMQAVAADAEGAFRREEGQTMAEYGVVLSVITLLVIAAFALLSTNVQNTIEGVASLFP